MPKKQGNRILINMACTECRERTYSTQKNRRNDTQRMELNKFCPRCHVRRLHREVR